jgi:hypothetical protein
MTIVNGGDNIAAYTPIFANQTPQEITATVTIFAALTVFGASRRGGWSDTRRWASRCAAMDFLLPFILIGLGGLILYRSGALRLAMTSDEFALRSPGGPDLPIYGADLIGLAVAAERADNPGPGARSHRLDAFGFAHEQLERGDSASTSSTGARTPSSPSVMIISAAPARVATKASPTAIASSMVSPKPSTREAKT